MLIDDEVFVKSRLHQYPPTNNFIPSPSPSCATASSTPAPQSSSVSACAAAVATPQPDPETCLGSTAVLSIFAARPCAPATPLRQAGSLPALSPVLTGLSAIPFYASCGHHRGARRPHNGRPQASASPLFPKATLSSAQSLFSLVSLPVIIVPVFILTRAMGMLSTYAGGSDILSLR